MAVTFLTQIIKVLDYIGNAHIKLGELEQGIQAREESLHFAEKLYGLKHRRCVKVCATLSFSYLRLGKFSKSIKYAEKAGSALHSHNTFEHGCKWQILACYHFLHKLSPMCTYVGQVSHGWRKRGKTSLIFNSPFLVFNKTRASTFGY